MRTVGDLRPRSGAPAVVVAEERAAPRTGRRPPKPAPTPSPRRFGLGRTVLLLTAALAVPALLTAYLLAPVRPADERPAARTTPAADPGRTLIVSEGISREQMRPVWELVAMAGIPETCGGAKVWSVAEKGGAADDFIIFCRRRGFWVVESDREAKRFGSVGPLDDATVAETVIDPEAEFVWAGRRPTFRAP